MEYFELIFRFDNEDNSLTRQAGLSIDMLVGFLKFLNKAIPGKENQLVLSEIKGNCYAPVINTPIKTEFEHLKNLHSEIAAGNLEGLNKNEKSYYNFLANLRSKNLMLSVYDNNKDFYKRLDKIQPPVSFPYYYTTNVAKGFLTRIGSRNLESENSIFISTYPNEIKINSSQDEALRPFYKNQPIEVYITEKINKDSKKVENAVLDHFEVVEEKSFYKSIAMVREKFGEYFADQLNNSENE